MKPLDLVTEVDEFGHRWVRDLIAWPARWWPGDPMERPRVHFCGFWGECRSFGAAPNIAVMGLGHHVMVWVPSSRNTRRFHFSHHRRSR